MLAKKKLTIFLLAFILVSFCFFSVPIQTQEVPENGNIGFESNNIPFLDIHFVEEFFRFKWDEVPWRYRAIPSPTFRQLDVKLVIVYTTDKGVKHFSLKDFWRDVLKPQGAKRSDVINQVTDALYEFGFNVSNIPLFVANNVEYVYWKLEGANFDMNRIELEEVEMFEENVTIPELHLYNATRWYNVTRLHLPSNLVLSYEDLWKYGYVVTQPNKTHAIVENIKGKTSWNLDPITYSAPTITVTGFTSSVPCTFWGLWNASYVNGWNVVNKNLTLDPADYPNYPQFMFDARLVIGDGNTATWFADNSKQITLNNGVKTAVDQRFIDVRNNAKATFGALHNLATKRTRYGIDFIDLTSAYYGWILYPQSDSAIIYIYSCSFRSVADCRFVGQRMWNVIADWQTHVHFPTLTTSDVNNLIVSGTYHGIRSPRVGTTINNLFITAISNAIWLHLYAGTIKNVWQRGSTYDVRVDTTGANNHYLINVDAGRDWLLNWVGTNTGKVFRQYEFDLRMIYENGTAMQGANATLVKYTSPITNVGSWLTPANGSIPQQTLTKCWYNQTYGDVAQEDMQFGLTIMKDGYQTYIGNFTLEDKTDWTLVLQEKGEKEYVWDFVTPLAISSLFMVLGTLGLVAYVKKGKGEKKNGF